MDHRKNIKVKFSKLGREKSWGYAHYEDYSVEVDIRARGKKLLEILTHESTHLILPEADEDEVERISIAITNMLWSQGYRRVDNSNTVPMQDGKK